MLSPAAEGMTPTLCTSNQICIRRESIRVMATSPYRWPTPREDKTNWSTQTSDDPMFSCIRDTTHSVNKICSTFTMPVLYHRSMINRFALNFIHYLHIFSLSDSKVFLRITFVYHFSDVFRKPIKL